MDRRMLFRLTLGVVLLAAISLSCQLVNDISELRSVATDIQGLATDINIEGLATNIDLESVATEVDIQALVTEIDIEALTTEVGGIFTGTLDVGSVISDVTGLLGSGVIATPNGFPVDIPVMTGDAVVDMDGSPTTLEYTVDAELQEMVDFYRREMAARGWVEAAGSTLANGKATMTFQQGARVVFVTIEEDFLLGSVVTITVQQ